MKSKCIYKVPDNPEWVHVSLGCPRKEIRHVRVRLASGVLATAVYTTREKKWYHEESGKELSTVVAWKLLPDSFRPNVE